MPPTLETERLILRPFQPEDTTHHFELFSHPEAMRFMPTAPHSTIEETQMALFCDVYRPGAHYWSICLKGTDNPIGQIHYLGETRIPGLGYIIHPDYWGQGYTPEACRVVLDYGFKQLNYDRIELWINEENHRSQRVAQKLGFQLQGRLPQKYAHKREQHTMFVYGRLASDWHQEPTPSTTRFFQVEPVLMVHDVQKTADYYRDKLGFHIDFLYGQPATHGGVSRGEWSSNRVTIQLSQVPEDRPLTHAGHLFILVSTDIDQLYAQYRANGVQIEQKPASKPWGMREFVIQEINGHRLVFATHT